MYYTSGQPAPLTAEQIKNLREATKVVFEHIKPSRNESGMGRVRYDLEVRARGRVATVEDVKLEVGTKIESFSKYDEATDTTLDVDYLGDDLSAFDMTGTPRYNDRWETVLAVVRPGDRLWLRWRRGNDCGYLEKSSPRLYLDELFVVLERARGKPERGLAPLWLTFGLRASVCEANTARMVRTKTEMCGW